MREAFEERDLSHEERTLIEGMLRRALPDPALYLEQLGRARVVGACSCGCASIDFVTEYPTGMQILADFVFGDLGGCFVFAVGGVLAGLEVWSVNGATATALPRLEDLRPFGE